MINDILFHIETKDTILRTLIKNVNREESCWIIIIQ